MHFQKTQDFNYTPVAPYRITFNQPERSGNGRTNITSINQPLISVEGSYVDEEIKEESTGANMSTENLELLMKTKMKSALIQ